MDSLHGDVNSQEIRLLKSSSRGQLQPREWEQRPGRISVVVSAKPELLCVGTGSGGLTRASARTTLRPFWVFIC
jgi:hypothetical protein